MKKLLPLFICLFTFTNFGQVDEKITEKIYRDDKYSFAVRYPSDWKPVESSSVNTRFRIASDGGIGLADFNIVVITPKELQGMTSAEFANDIAKRPDIIKAMVETGLPGAKLLSSGKTYLSNREAFFVKYTGTMRSLDDETDLTVYQIITVFEGKSITLTCRSLKEVFDILYFDTCKEIASSFVLLPTKVVVPPKNKVTKKRKT
jgi:hypothetical protein